jgi:hypothetical protein
MLQGLLEAYTTEVSRGGSSDGRRVRLLATAACELLRGHASLGDHAVGLGYADRLLAVLTPRLKAASAGGISLHRCSTQYSRVVQLLAVS